MDRSEIRHVDLENKPQLRVPSVIEEGAQSIVAA
jgi:hypothetical protein